MNVDKAQEKKRFRNHRHSLQRAVMRNHFSRETKLGMTQNQIKQASKKIVDQIIAGRNPQYAEAKDDPRGEGLVTLFEPWLSHSCTDHA